MTKLTITREEFGWMVWAAFRVGYAYGMDASAGGLDAEEGFLEQYPGFEFATAYAPEARKAAYARTRDIAAMEEVTP